MSEPASDAVVVIDLGGVALHVGDDGNGIGIDYPLEQGAADFYHGVLERLEKLGELPRLLFVAATSSGREAGVSAVGLARAVAGRNVRSLLVDASLFEPVLSKPFPYQPDEGLVDMVLWGSSIQAALRKTRDEQIQFVGVGSPPSDPEAVYRSGDLAAVLNTFREQADLVLIVGPLFRPDGELSPLVRRSDRTLIVRRESEPVPAIHADLPVGHMVEITIGAAPSKSVAAAPEGPSADETVTLIVGEEDELDEQAAAPREGRGEREPASPSPDGRAAAEAAAGAAGSEAAKGEPARAPAAGTQTAPPIPQKKRAKPAPAVRPGAQGETRKLPLGRFILLFGVSSVVIGLVLSFFWVRGRFSSPMPFSEPPRVAEALDTPGDGTGTAGDAAGRETGTGETEGGGPAVGGSDEQPGSALPARTDAAETDAPPQEAGPATGEEGGPAGGGSPGTDGPPAGDNAGGATAPAAANNDAAQPAADAPGAGQEQTAGRQQPPARPSHGASTGERIYGVHVESFPTGAEADEAARPYLDAGYPVTIRIVDIPGKGIWHRIILGRFSTKAEADQFATEVKEVFGLGYTLTVRIDR